MSSASYSVRIKGLHPHWNQLGTVTRTDYGLKRVALNLKKKISFFSFLNQFHILFAAHSSATLENP